MEKERQDRNLAPGKRIPCSVFQCKRRTSEMNKTVRARYTLEFKQEAVRLVTGG